MAISLCFLRKATKLSTLSCVCSRLIKEKQRYIFSFFFYLNLKYDYLINKNKQNINEFVETIGS